MTKRKNKPKVMDTKKQEEVKPKIEDKKPVPQQETIIQNEENVLVDDGLLLNLTNDILDKQYRLYSWADSKTASLIQTNSILLATIGFIFKDCLNDVLATIFVFLAIGANVVSLYFCLRQVKPQKSSGKGVSDIPNLRALSGILKIKSWQEYHDKLIRINNKQLYEFSARQIYGMAFNVEESRINTTKAMKITLFGIAFLILSFISVSFASNNKHYLGTWQKVEIKKVDTLKVSIIDTTKVLNFQPTNKKDTIIKKVK